MTSLLSIGPEYQGLEGRTVRDIVEHDPAQVNEVWCRKIFRQLLQSLELQYAMHMPHRAITPDTVVFHDNGEPLLLPVELSAPAAEPEVGADLTALARVVHFAITRELAPAGPLQGRAPEGYSESLIAAVDRCMYGDPATRPRSVDELRDILGIVSLGPTAPGMAPIQAAAPAPAAPPMAMPLPAETMSAAPPAPAAEGLPSFMQAPGQPRRAGRAGGLGAGLGRWQRWALAAGGGAVLVAIALALFAELRDSGSYDHIVLTLPQQQEGARAPEPAGRANGAAPLADPGAGGAIVPPVSASTAASTDASPLADGGPMPAGATPRAPNPHASAAPAVQAAAPAAAPQPAAGGNLAYRLQIQPWGVVYVDGVDRGVSPPVKRLELAPGRHSIRIANPNFHDRVLEVDTAGGGGQITVDFRDESRSDRSQ